MFADPTLYQPLFMMIGARTNASTFEARRPHLTLAVLPPTRTDYGRLPLLCSAQLPPRTTSPVHVDDPTPVPTGNISVPHRISTTVCAFLPEEINKLVDWSNISNFKFQEDSIYGYVSHLINSDNKPKDDYEKLLRQYQKHYLSNLICSHTDKANMNFSIEARAPFLDKDLFEYTNSAKNNLKNKNGVSKLILRSFLSKNNLAEVGKARKKGFTVPMAFWINGSLKEEIMDSLSEKEINNFGLIKYSQVKDILNSHFSGKENNYKKIYNLFVLFKWLKKNNVTY